MKSWFIVFERPIYPDTEDKPAGVWLISNKNRGKPLKKGEVPDYMPAQFGKRSLAHAHADVIRKTRRGHWHGVPDQLSFEALVIEVMMP